MRRKKICNARDYFLYVDRFISKDIIVPNRYLARSSTSNTLGQFSIEFSKSLNSYVHFYA